MNTPLQITFRNMPHSAAIEANVREKAAKLDALYDGITSCRVIVEAPHRHHYKGKAYVVRIDIVVPNGELVINRAPKRLDAAKATRPQELEKDLEESHEPSRHAAHEDVYVAIRDAFNAATRKLQDYAGRRRSKKKNHEPAPLARVVKLCPNEDHGFIKTRDGRQLYFHKSSVLNGGFNHLRIGTEVAFNEELGDRGPQASTVRPIN